MSNDIADGSARSRTDEAKATIFETTYQPSSRVVSRRPTRLAREAALSLGEPGCKWAEGMDAVRRFGTDYAALQCGLLQPGGPPGDLLQKILVVRTVNDFAQPSVAHAVDRLSQPWSMAETLRDHALDCRDCRRGVLPRSSSFTKGQSKLRHVLSVLESHQSIPYLFSWGTELSHPRPTDQRTDCSISHLRQQVETWECTTYEGLNGLLWRYAEAINDVRYPAAKSAKSATDAGEEMDGYFRIQYDRTLARLCWDDLRTYQSRIDAASKHDRTLLDQVAHGSAYQGDLWLLDHAKSCASCASHSTLNEALWTDDHPQDYKPWRSHPAWLDLSQIKRSVANLETVRRQLDGTFSKTQDDPRTLPQEAGVRNDRAFSKLYYNGGPSLVPCAPKPTRTNCHELRHHTDRCISQLPH